MVMRDFLYTYSWGFWLLLHICLSWYYAPHVSDDAFIFFRYAENWSDGLGPVWNQGERVEGYSSPLWLLILALGHQVGLPVPSSAKILGIGFGFAVVLLVGRLVKHVGCQEHRGWLMCGASLTAGLHYWSPTGLETSMYAFLWCASLLALVENRWTWAVALLGVARPEGPFVLFFWFLADAVASNRIQWKRYVLVLLPTFCWLLFRWFYYGEVLPNTYYAKVGGDPWVRFTVGFQYIFWPFVCWLLIAALAIVERSKISSVLLLFIGLQLFVVSFGGGDWMTNGRMLIAILLPLWAWVRITPWQASTSVVLLFCLTKFWVPWGAVSALANGNQLRTLAFQEGQLYKASKVVSKAIRKNLPPNSTIALNHAGFLPYLLPDYRFIDLTGLNDKHIAHEVSGGLHQKYDSKYVLSREPDLIVFNSHTKPSARMRTHYLDYWEGETNLARQSLFLQNYARVAKSWERQRHGGDSAYIILYIRKRIGFSQ